VDSYGKTSAGEDDCPRSSDETCTDDTYFFVHAMTQPVKWKISACILKKRSMGSEILASLNLLVERWRQIGRPTDARSESQISVAQKFVVFHLRAAAAKHHSSAVQDIGAIGQCQRFTYGLLDQQNRLTLCL